MGKRTVLMPRSKGGFRERRKDQEGRASEPHIESYSFITGLSRQYYVDLGKSKRLKQIQFFSLTGRWRITVTFSLRLRGVLPSWSVASRPSVVPAGKQARLRSRRIRICKASKGIRSYAVRSHVNACEYEQQAAMFNWRAYSDNGWRGV